MSPFDFRVLSYVAGLEITVDRLRKQCRLLQLEARDAVAQIDVACHRDPTTALPEIQELNRKFAEVLADLDDPEIGEDRVADIAFRPLVEKLFRRHQRLTGLDQVQLQLELTCEQIIWFPERLRHILENLISNALKYNDPTKGEARIQVGLRRCNPGYELRIVDNGLGFSRDAQARLFELFDRSGTAHLANPVVGVAVLKQLIEESGGSLAVESVEGQGAAFVAMLPHFSLTDHLK
ncbi:MAG: sensor histidine kinase [Planctomycetes bacterium]|nr:sensor histidine kinase [Planctomycetota bacterium]